MTNGYQATPSATKHPQQCICPTAEPTARAPPHNRTLPFSAAANSPQQGHGILLGRTRSFRHNTTVGGPGPLQGRYSASGDEQDKRPSACLRMHVVMQVLHQLLHCSNPGGPDFRNIGELHLVPKLQAPRQFITSGCELELQHGGGISIRAGKPPDVLCT